MCIRDRTGGVLEGPGSGALQKKREIAELAETVAATEARYNEMLTRHYALQKQILHTEELLQGLQRSAVVIGQHPRPPRANVAPASEASEADRAARADDTQDMAEIAERLS